MTLDGVLTVAEVAEKLKVSKWLIYRAIETGKLTPVRIGRLVRLSQSEIDNWLRSQAHSGSAA